MFTNVMADTIASARQAEYRTAGRAARLGRRVRHTVAHTPGSRRTTWQRVSAAAQI